MKPATVRFIEKAIEGGWENRMQNAGDWHANGMHFQALLDPDLWRCAGKALGWQVGEHTQMAQDLIYQTFAEGKSVEEFLATLLPAAAETR